MGQSKHPATFARAKRDEPISLVSVAMVQGLPACRCGAHLRLIALRGINRRNCASYKTLVAYSDLAGNCPIFCGYGAVCG